MIPIFGATKIHSTRLQGKQGLTHKRPSYQPTGTRHLPSSVSAWRSLARKQQILSPSTRALTRCTHWSLKGNSIPTSVGREMWKSLLGSQGSLQLHCNIEGFNAVSGSSSHPKARIGIIANNENSECNSCDSRIGFGSGGFPDDSNTCGINAQTYADNGSRHIKVMGYILIQWH